MPARTDIKSILIIGSGPIVIGQACEFDYSGVQAVRALKEEGYRVVLINPNQATVMTTPGLADRVYVEPLTVDYDTHLWDPLKVDDLTCPEIESGVDEPHSITVSFNNNLQLFQPVRRRKTSKKKPRRLNLARYIRVTPRPRKMKLECEDRECTIKGYVRRGRTYRIRVLRGIRDEHGQRLKKAYSGRCKVPHLSPQFVRKMVPEPPFPTRGLSSPK